MQPNAYSRPDDRELLRASLRLLSGRFRPAVLFAGLASGERLQLTDFLGTATSSLHQVVVVPGAGLGGRVFTQRRPFLVEDYIASEGITHEYDLAVRRERLTSMAAVPVVVKGTSRAVLYIASRDSAPMGENAVCEAMAAAAEIAGELRIRDEVDRRVSIIDTATGRACPGSGPELAGACPGSPRRTAVPGRHGVRSSPGAAAGDHRQPSGAAARRRSPPDSPAGPP